MATYTSSAVTNRANAFSPFPDGTLGVRTAEYEVAADEVETAHTYQMIPVFAGETVYDVILQTDDLDAVTSLVLDVGDGDVVDRYIDGSTIGQTGGTQRFGATPGAAPTAVEFPRTYTADDTIDVLVATVTANSTAGTIRLIAFIG